jgi:hypothetical protein
MRIRIERTFLAYTLLLPCAAALVIVSRPAFARSPQPVTISVFDGMVMAEPGEDPHLKIEPQIDVRWIDEFGSSAPPTSDSSGRDPLGRSAVPRDETRSSRVHSKFLARLRLLFGMTGPR